MENKKIQTLWKSIEDKTPEKSREELHLLLQSKTRQTINKFLLVTGLSVFICLLFILFLILAISNRTADHMYVLINVILIVIAIVSCISGMWSWFKLHHNTFNLPLKLWLEKRISYISHSLNAKSNKLYVLLIPLINILTILSIHVYYENNTFWEVIRTEDSIAALVAGGISGLIVSYYVARKIRKFHLHNLRFLRDIYKRLEKLT